MEQEGNSYEANVSLCMPSFLRRLQDPSIKTVMLTGCGGGFDFVHSMILYPELMRLHKTVIIGSYSFGNPERISNADQYFSKNAIIAKKVTAESRGRQHYAPEVHMCSFLDEQFPKESPHFIYAYYARDFTVPLLLELYKKIIDDHSVDAVVMFDGGSDSLVIGRILS